MKSIKRITVSGFRGIVTPLELSFVKGGSTTSMVLFGRNGFGKISLTDAWEWMQTDRIVRLGREGAGPNAFPHRDAADGDSFVEVEFANLGLGKIIFNQKKVTMPSRDGVIDAFRQAAPYPCTLRYEDLTQFVYSTKAEQYDALAVLMSFTPQVEYQKMLRRVSRKLEEESNKQTAVADREETKLAEIIGEKPDATKLLKFLQGKFIDANAESPATVSEATKALEGLTEAIKSDPRAASLADHISLRKCIDDLNSGAVVEADLAMYSAEVETFKNTERDAVDLMLIGLYEKGQEVIEKRDLGEDAPCPLCGNIFQGSLAEHIQGELESLHSLKSAKDKLEASRLRQVTSISSYGTLAKALKVGTKGNKVATELLLKEITDACKALDACFSELSDLLKVTPDKVTADTSTQIRRAVTSIADNASAFDALQKGLLEKIDAEIESLRDDGSREKLVNAASQITLAMNQWDEYIGAKACLLAVMKKRRDFEAITINYISTSNADIEAKFNSISADVEKYFGILEEHTEGVGRPVLRLQMDQDRAVTLEIEFRGEPISPAYKYLSESQLNSFGLALFLAAARRFNVGFRFLLLDDIVNSFDAYKRPQLIRLLKSEFGDFQFLLLTHDEVWCEQLFSNFPQWVRKRITRYDVTTGPIIQDGLCDLEKVEKDLDDDLPSRAGQLLGPMLERELQEMCEAFEASVAYNRRNEYTLKPLLTRLIVRVKEKLKSAHKLTVMLNDLDANSAFRNFCAHWKTPSSPITTQEVREVLRIWKNIVAMVKCSEEKCTGYAKYDNGTFVCNCKKLRLAKGDPA
ncbi:hypothetical protein [Bremerella sp. P1]|uniref:hypothetical protein n=1 Tax=Bremerella sp. P1 TaxID=3026424 RepID=UPI002367B19E|nr:hypothetical protein [Bremerella sp. P1]WDI43376.1 hypothetical protein PSR63_05380 [Bremerella sp. P1]